MESKINEFKMEETYVELENNIIHELVDFHCYGLQSSKHIHETHQDLHKPTDPKDCSTCPVCKHIFTLRSNRNRHIKYQHSSQSSTPLKSSPVRPLKCDICEKNFKSMKSLQGHRRRIHREFTNMKKHKCPLCPQMLKKHFFNDHFKEKHNLLLKSVNINFNSYEEFCEWKKAIERVTKSYFSKQSSQIRHGITHHILVCHRSGTFKSKASENKRKLKAQGSRKINAFCPAVIKAAIMSDGKCEIKFQSHHIGHENELQHLNLTYDERKYIADKLAANLSLSDVLNDIRNSASKNNAERLCLLTKHDLCNIKSSLLFDKRLQISPTKSNENLFNILSDIHSKHTESKHIRADITKIEKGWVLTLTEDDETYFIKENSKSCDCCFICAYCKICIKSYICSCSDSFVEGNMCKHIHFFCMENNNISDSNNSVDVLEKINVPNNMMIVSGSNNSIDVPDNDSVDVPVPENNTVTKFASNLKECSYPKTSNNILVPTELLIRKNPTFVKSKRRNILKKKFCSLIDSLTTEEECKLSESTFEELNSKLKSIHGQDHSMNKGESLNSVSEKQGGHNLSSLKMPLFSQVPNRSGQGGKFYSVHLLNQKSSNNVFKK